MNLKTKILFTALCISCSLFSQNFKPVQIDPFGINIEPYSINDMEFADLTRDGLFDIIFNEMDFLEGPFILVNKGSDGYPDFDGVEYKDFIVYSQNGLGFGSFTAHGTQFYDLDKDGDPELIDAVHSEFLNLPATYIFETNVAESFPPLLYFFDTETDGTEIGLPLLPFYTFESFTFGDIDGDTDDDIIACRFNEPTGVHQFVFYENIGGSGPCMFNNVAVIDPFGLSPNSDGKKTNGVPSVMDVDIDGDLDIFIINNEGNWHFYENVGTKTNAEFSNFVVNPFGLSKLEQGSEMAFALDVNNDGNKDFMVGSGNNIHYFEWEKLQSSVDFSVNKIFKLSPNPAQDQISLVSEAFEILSVEIYSLDNKPLVFDYFFNKNTQSIDIKELPSGIYFILILTNEGFRKMERFVKI